MSSIAASVADRIRSAVGASVPQLRRIAEAEASSKPSPAKWSKKEILGHLIDSAANNHQRFVRAQLAGELTFPGYQQEAWVGCQDYLGADWNTLLDLWKAYNEHLAHLVSRIPSQRLSTPCSIGGGEPRPLADLIEDYLRHLEHHLEQLDGQAAPREEG